MNCERCQELLSDFIDGEVPAGESALVSRHLGDCRACAAARDELTEIVVAAREARIDLVAPPSERALWLRIRNTIEADERALAAGAAAASSVPGFWSRLAGRRLAFTLPQFATAVAGVVVAAALITAVGMRSVLEARRAEESARQAAAAKPQRQLSRDEMMMVEYLKQRVDERRNRWDPRMRDAFDRNMSVIDATVDDMLRELGERPHDEVSEEGLREAMRNKIELLKEFSEL